jgi:hypothetical protein
MIKNILNDLIDKNSTRNLSIKKILKKTHDNKKNSMIYIYIFFDRKDIKVFVWGKLKRQLEHETKITNLTITDLKYFL